MIPHRESPYDMDSAFHRLYILLFLLSFLVFLLALSYKRKFKAVEFEIGDCEDASVLATMQKVLAAG